MIESVYNFRDDSWELYTDKRLVMSISREDVIKYRELYTDDIPELYVFETMCAVELFKEIKQAHSFAVGALLRNIVLHRNDMQEM